MVLCYWQQLLPGPGSTLQLQATPGDCFGFRAFLATPSAITVLLASPLSLSLSLAWVLAKNSYSYGLSSPIATSTLPVLRHARGNFDAKHMAAAGRRGHVILTG